MTQLPNHPDSRREYEHLQRTRDEIDRATREARALLNLADDDEAAATIDISAADMEVQAQMALIRLDHLRKLGLAAGQAYFAHLDFLPDGERPETWYLGRWGVLGVNADPVVVDWRSPVANLYYSGQLGRVDYEAPDGRVAGELTLKRMLTVRDRDLISLFDSGLVSQEAYLQEVLGSVSSDRLKEIVTTIQAEQNRVIRQPLNTDLMVQGIAGSGKTTVALHRIAYLLYAHQNILHPENMMILAPNPLFLSYISQLLPDLGVERVRQTTFAEWCVKAAGKAFPKFRISDRLEDNLTIDGGERERRAVPVRRKGSLEMLNALDLYLEALPERVLPAEGLKMGPFEVIGRKELEDMFLVQYSHYPVHRRTEELKKPVKRRVVALCEKLREHYETMTQDRLNILLNTLPDGPERRGSATRLFAARDKRFDEIEQKKTEFLKQWPRLFVIPDPVELYLRFLEQWDPETYEATAAYAGGKTIRAEDLAPVLLICAALYGLKTETFKHIVVDECQDLSPFRLAVLKRYHPTATFTLVGDLHQGIHADEGIRTWESWIGPVFGGQGILCEMKVSYRSTMEIMELAGKTAAKYPITGVSEGEPVLRHGEEPRIITVKTENERIGEIVQQVNGYLQDGYHSIALIEKTRKQADALYRKLKDRLPVRLMKEDDSEYQGGVLILPASMVKGMEFDCVVLCDASAANFPDDEFHDRVLYVLLTRPLHRLTVLSRGPLTELLQ
ncbi:MAG: AAA family ATPase [Clostridia bacterium]|nr:AAA family ATPase [Clostridia bacterium]